LFIIVDFAVDGVKLLADCHIPYRYSL
jgi:hypothetical protein